MLHAVAFCARAYVKFKLSGIVHQRQTVVIHLIYFHSVHQNPKKNFTTQHFIKQTQQAKPIKSGSNEYYKYMTGFAKTDLIVTFSTLRNTYLKY